MVHTCILNLWTDIARHGYTVVTDKVSEEISMQKKSIQGL